MMKALRCSFDEVHEEAVNVAGIWCVNTTFTEKRIGRAPRMCRIPRVQLYLSPKFAYEELAWDSLARSVGVSVLESVSSYRRIRHRSYLT